MHRVLIGFHFVDYDDWYNWVQYSVYVFYVSKIEHVIAMNVKIITSFCLHQSVKLSALRMLRVFFDLTVVTFMCCKLLVLSLE